MTTQKLQMDKRAGSNTLANPLDRFSSYSTQFVMLACRTSQVAKEFSQETSANAAKRLAAIDATTQLGEPIDFNGSANDIFLVIDTRRFSQFIIENLKYEVLINGLVNKESHANVPTLIDMTVVDNTGISFINYMQWLMDVKLQTNFDGLIFLLKIIFVGHNDDGTTELVHSVILPMHLYKMELSLDAAKGQYNCQFMPNINFSVNHHSRWLNIGQATTYFTGQSTNRLGDIIKSFEQRLNKASEEFYDRVKKLYASNGVVVPSDKFGRKVQYSITLPTTPVDWNDYVFEGQSVQNIVETKFQSLKAEQDKVLKEQAEKAKEKNAQTTATASYVSVDPNMTITQVLESIFDAVPKIKQFANTDRLKAGEDLQFYKYLLGVTSTNDIFTVHVDVIPFVVPNVKPPTEDERRAKIQANQDSFYKLSDPSNPYSRLIPKNFFELDYIFTGKNIDVLSLDLKLQDLQILLASNVRVGQGELFMLAGNGQAAQVKDQDGKIIPKPEVLAARRYDPILMPLATDLQRKNFGKFLTQRNAELAQKNNEDAQAYTRNLSAFYTQCPVMSRVTIRGNPHIMSKFCIETCLPNRDPAAEPDPAEYRKKLERDILGKGVTQDAKGYFTINPIGDASFMSHPVFMKLNIKGPNVDFVTQELINGKDFATDILYDNYYIVFKVVNVFERGSFTQELEVWLHTLYGNNKLQKPEA